VPYEGPIWSREYPDLATILQNQTERQYNAGLPRRITVGLNLGVNNTALTPWEQSQKGWYPSNDELWSTGGGFTEAKYCTGCVDGLPAEAVCNGCFSTWANFGILSNQSSPFEAADPLRSLNFTLKSGAPVWAHGWVRIPEESIGPDGV